MAVWYCSVVDVCSRRFDRFNSGARIELLITRTSKLLLTIAGKGLYVTTGNFSVVVNKIRLHSPRTLDRLRGRAQYVENFAHNRGDPRRHRPGIDRWANVFTEGARNQRLRNLISRQWGWKESLGNKRKSSRISDSKGFAPFIRTEAPMGARNEYRVIG